MGKVAVVTDSSTCLPRQLVDSYAIQVLPISVHLPDGDHEVGPGAEENFQLSQAIENEELLAANRPFVTEYLEAIERPGYEAAVVITPAIEFATMYRNAALAAELATRPAVTIDVRTAAAGQALVTLAGAAAAASGADLEEVVRVVEEASRRVELVASLATLDPIRRNVSLPDVAPEDEQAGLRSVFRMHDGTVEPIETSGSTEATLQAIVDAFGETTPAGVERTTVFHSGAPELAAALAERLGGVDFISGFSVAMQVHTGRGVLGAAWLPSVGREQ